jgi:hypothetical protein
VEPLVRETLLRIADRAPPTQAMRTKLSSQSANAARRTSPAAWPAELYREAVASILKRFVLRYRGIVAYAADL